MSRFLLAFVALALAAGCGSGDPSQPTDSGIAGLVLIGPQCPIVQEGVPCPDEPFETELRVRTDGGEEVLTTRSGPDGRFQLALAPGRYLVEPVAPNPGAPPQAAAVEVEVAPHEYTELTIVYDSGIR
jgi:hypothetical protein